MGQAELVVVDLRRVMRVDRGGLEMLSGLAVFLDERGGKLALTSPQLDEISTGVDRFRSSTISTQVSSGVKTSFCSGKAGARGHSTPGSKSTSFSPG